MDKNELEEKLQVKTKIVIKNFLSKILSKNLYPKLFDQIFNVFQKYYFRKQMAEKLKFRTEEIEEAKRVIDEKEISEDKPSDIPLEDIESTKSKIIKIPTEQSHTPDAPPETLPMRSVSRASRTSSRAAAPSRATPTRAVTSRAATSRADSNGSRLSVRSKSDHSEKLQRLQRCV